MFITGSRTEAQHNSADVWWEGRGGRRAATGPRGCEEHVQNANRWTIKKSKIVDFANGLTHTDCKNSFTSQKSVGNKRPRHLNVLFSEKRVCSTYF